MAQTLMLTMNWFRSDASSLLHIPVSLYVTFKTGADVPSLITHRWTVKGVVISLFVTLNV